MKPIALFMCIVLLLAGCAQVPEDILEDIPTVTTSVVTTTATATDPTGATTLPNTEPPDPLSLLLDSMTLEERVGQLFLVAPPEDPLSAIASYHFGGYILFDSAFNRKTPESVQQTISAYQAAASVPMLIAVDEEGGSVCRASAHTQFRASRFPSPRKLFNEGGIPLLSQTEAEKCLLLQYLGINVNMAPVCDITTDPNAFMYGRSLGQSPEITAQCITSIVDVMRSHDVGSVLKHFPGYGNNTDTHVAMAVDNRSLTKLESVDLVPFQAGIDAGCGAIMVSHTIVTAIDAQYPATLSPAVHDYLRNIMGFAGVIITDDLQMDAIADYYGQGEAAVLAILAGNDLLCSWTYETQYDAVLEAVKSGRITEEQINDSVLRILRWKKQLNLLS